MTFSARGLTHRVGGRTLFADLSFDVAEGETLVVEGPSGAGKSQLLRVLAWLERPIAGEVSLGGVSVRRVAATWWRANVAYVAQEAAVFPGSPLDLAEAVARFRAQSERPSDDPVALAATWDLDPALWRRPWVDLSGGERQRAALAVAVARRPRVLLLDEPTAALHPEAGQAVEACVRGRTTVWVTHDRAVAARVGHHTLRLP